MILGRILGKSLTLDFFSIERPWLLEKIILPCNFENFYRSLSPSRASTRAWPLGSSTLVVVGRGPCVEAQAAKGREGVVGVTSPCADTQAARGWEGGGQLGQPVHGGVGDEGKGGGRSALLARTQRCRRPW